MTSLGLPPYRRWYRFGFRSPIILWKRVTSRRRWLGRPLWALKMRRQRAQRGWSEQDVWSLDYHLTNVIIGSITELREISHGHPLGITVEEWDKILGEIVEGMEAAKIIEETWEHEGENKEKFDLAFAHLHKWWFALWD